ncbi:hypothetical protein AB1Y20_017804 [Prymnesium parvum]|uniref:Hexosyltransferase n=1 Tax=Prymnesium parvum TaxID=97485 RepID=A0AB34JPG1_PRYPA
MAREGLAAPLPSAPAPNSTPAARAEPLTLVLGVLPSEKPRPLEWEAHAARRASARASWLSLRPAAVLVRFVVERTVPHTKLRHEALLLERRRHADVVALTAEGDVSGCLQAELLRLWFAHALEAWPHARYYGKTEDDIYVQLRLLHFDLARLSSPLLWLGLFQWSGNSDAQARAGCWGGAFEDDVRFGAKVVQQLLMREHKCPSAATPITPAPSRELDVRSRALAVQGRACAYASAWLEAQPRRHDRRTSGGCSNDYSAVQGRFLSKCVVAQVTLAHLTWTKVHSNAADSGWRPFAPPSNLTLALDMNLGDKKLRKDLPGAWVRAHAVMGPSQSTSFPPLLYTYNPRRSAGDPVLVFSLNPDAARLHSTTCQWGGCHPSRGDMVPIMQDWIHSSACDAVAPPVPRASTCQLLDETNSLNTRTLRSHSLREVT